LTKADVNRSKEDELLGKLAVYEDEKLSDRANWLIAANAFLINAFVTLIWDLKLTGFFLLIPIAISVAAIFLNAFWAVTNNFQKTEIIEPLRSKLADRKSEYSFKDYFELVEKKNGSPLSGLYMWAPILLAVLWAFMLAFYLLKAIFG